MDNSVPRHDVLIVLRAKGVSISALDHAQGTYLLAGNGWLEELTLTDPVHKNRLRYLSRKFKIDIYLFWHTEMLEYKPGENPN
jgi:hypothetical protein